MLESGLGNPSETARVRDEQLGLTTVRQPPRQLRRRGVLLSDSPRTGKSVEWTLCCKS